MSREFDPGNIPPAERALTDAKEAFHTAMMECGPFVDLVMAHITDPRQQAPTELPDFGCEPWRYIDHTGKPDGYGVRLTFSATSQEDALRATVSTFDYIKVARITEAKELFAGVLVDDIEDRQPDVTDVEDRARSIVSSYLAAFNKFIGTEIPGDQLTVDELTGAFELASIVDNTVQASE